MSIRPELLRRARADGGLDLYDPLLERITTLSSAEVAALDAPDAALAARLAAALLVEGPVAEELRRRVWSARALPLAEAPRATPTTLDPGLASALPSWIAPAWRDPEAWRRIAEDRAAGRARLVLRGFVDLPVARALAAEAAALAYTRFDTEVVRGWRADPTQAGDTLAAWRALLLDPNVRALLGGALGVALPGRLVANAWRMDPADGMRVHPDGRRYAATWALGLCEAWSAGDGGAIAFGTPSPDGLRVEERWLPFLGDVCLFVPHGESWHTVEPPRRPRLTLSGWWVSP